MPPASSVLVSPADGSPDSGSNVSAPGDPLVPLLPEEGGAPDPVALAMWHLALASATAVDVPHDLFALWLFPVTGGVVLVGPDALALDHVEIPEPSPFLPQDQLYRLEEVLRRARYASSIAVPIGDTTRDLGLMLLCGVIAALGTFFLAQGYRLAEANTVAPFEYVALPWGVLWGWLFFDNLPDRATLAGGAVIVASGLYILHRERRRRAELRTRT